MISVYSKKTEIELSQRKMEILDKYNKVIQYGRINPVWFIENIFKIELLDYQKFVIMNSWTAEKAIWTCSRNTGKTFMGSTFIMAKNILFPSFETWLMSLTAAQAQGLFRKIEDIAKKNIASIVGSSDVFFNEVVKSQANTDGFVHGQGSYYCELFNGSHITSLVGKPESVVGKRSNLNAYDEAGKISHDYFALTEPFTTQDTNFKTGEGVDLRVYPKSIPTQCLYMSSAEDVNSYLYELYKNGAKAMAMGRKDYFVADISCEIPLNPTKNGAPYPPLFKRSEVESAMRNNEYRAMREYYNVFDTSGGTDAVVSRDSVIKNEEDYLPVTINDGSRKSKYVICYDPALRLDNSFILVGEIFLDEKDNQIKGRILNGYNLIEQTAGKDKKILTSIEQLEFLRKVILRFNGNAEDYENVIVFMDPGAGGGGYIYGDFLMQDFVDEFGVTHRGLIDMEDPKSATEAPKFPNAVKDVLHLYSASKYKNDFFAAMGDLIMQDLVKFPNTSISSGKMNIKGVEKDLTKDEIRGLVEIDLMKEEAFQMRKIKTEAGNVKYSLPTDKIRKMHDDRAYCLAAFCYILSQERRKEKFNNVTPKQDFSKIFNSSQASSISHSRAKSNVNPFASKRNPFGR